MDPGISLIGGQVGSDVAVATQAAVNGGGEVFIRGVKAKGVAFDLIGVPGGLAVARGSILEQQVRAVSVEGRPGGARAGGTVDRNPHLHGEALGLSQLQWGEPHGAADADSGHLHEAFSRVCALEQQALALADLQASAATRDGDADTVGLHQVGVQLVASSHRGKPVHVVLSPRVRNVRHIGLNGGGAHQSDLKGVATLTGPKSLLHTALGVTRLDLPAIHHPKAAVAVGKLVKGRCGGAEDGGLTRVGGSWADLQLLRAGEWLCQAAAVRVPCELDTIVGGALAKDGHHVRGIEGGMVVAVKGVHDGDSKGHVGLSGEGNSSAEGSASHRTLLLALVAHSEDKVGKVVRLDVACATDAGEAKQRCVAPVRLRVVADVGQQQSHARDLHQVQRQVVSKQHHVGNAALGHRRAASWALHIELRGVGQLLVVGLQ
mmetsp:Transcript_33053/g.93555  ORF Transcript_33053/g.93555 Transcript_33053/m.93555 type:complete len:433 (+) Transcript_33053:478-1776(+)